MNSPDEGPEWADEAHLDEVFSTWVPGPPASASAAEREMAGENPPLENPGDDPTAHQDMDAALAAALAEAEEEGETPSFAPASDDADSFEGAETTDETTAWEIPAVDDAAQVGEPEPTPSHEPASPSWLNVPEPPPAVAPLTEPEPAGAAPVAEPVGDLGSAPAPAPEPADDHAFQPAPPPPAKVARPWTRTDDDILPNRRGKGRS